MANFEAIRSRREILREYRATNAMASMQDMHDYMRKQFPDITEGQFRSDLQALSKETISPTIRRKITSREKELANLVSIEARIKNLVDNPDKTLSSDMQLKIYMQLQGISSKKIKLIDEIEKEKELQIAMLQPKSISTQQALNQELSRKKLEEAEIKIQRLQENLVAKEEIENRWNIIEKSLAALVKTFQRDFGKDGQPTQLLLQTLKSIQAKLK
jgi:hypothetical protein